jgi:hypothetical protein
MERWLFPEELQKASILSWSFLIKERHGSGSVTNSNIEEEGKDKANI